jgi:hypothetical protein
MSYSAAKTVASRQGESPPPPVSARRPGLVSSWEFVRGDSTLWDAHHRARADGLPAERYEEDSVSL